MAKIIPMVYPVDMLLPDKWHQLVRYQLREDIVIAGHTVPAGFITDGATVPRWLWWLFPPVDRYFPAAAVHDHLLESGQPWRVANKFFRRALAECDVPTWRRKAMSAAVGVYGAYKETVAQIKTFF